MRPSDKLMLRDYATSRDRLRKPDHKGVIDHYMRGLCVIAVAVLAAWVLWQITGGIVTRWIGGY